MSDENRWQNDTEDYYNQNYYQSGTQGGAYGGGTGTGGRDDDPKRKYYRKGHTARWAAGIAAAAVLFGIVTGGTIGLVNLAADRMANSSQVEQSAEETEKASETEPQTEVSKDASDGGGTQEQAPAVIGNDVSAIVEEAMPSVVAIHNKIIYESNNFFFGPQTYQAESSGSGIIVGQNDAELLIVTNNHVVEDTTEMKVTFIDGTSVDAAIKGTDSESDLAVVAVQLGDIPAETLEQIKTATLGDSDELKVGQGVIAIGNALGYGQSVTVGYVSALNREVTTDGVTRTLLQTDAAINPGNSGGALVNMKGEVIGINSAKLASTEVEGMGYAIPITRVSSIIEELMNETTRTKVADSQKSSIGIAGITVDSNINAAYGIPAGVYVASVTPGSGAEAAGIRKGDVITKFDGKTVSTIQELKEKLQYYAAGEAVSITVQSPGEGGIYTEKELTITLSSAQSSEESQSTDNTQAAPEKGNGTHKAMGYQN